MSIDRNSSLARYWSLDPKVTFLNHGSFGACPIPVLDLQSALRERMEADPVRFLAHDFETLMADARETVAKFLSADADDLAFVPNATHGVNTVLKSLRFAPGDELLVTDHEYNACRNALTGVAKASGATVVVAKIPFPTTSREEILDAILSKITSRTKLALVDHVTSPTGLILPISELLGFFHSRGIDVLIDGAHAPGMIPLRLSELGTAYYTGNCHKWLCAPKGAAFLYVRKDRQDRIRPLAISHGANSPRTDVSRFRLEFDWTGTDDPTPALCIPRAIEFIGSLDPGGWHGVMKRNHALALEARKILCDALQIPAATPEEMIGSMASFPLQPSDEGIGAVSGMDPLHEKLLEEFSIQVPVFPWPAPPKRVLRISAQLYNSAAQYSRLGEVLRSLLTNSRI